MKYVIKLISRSLSTYPCEGILISPRMSIIARDMYVVQYAHLINACDMYVVQ